MDLQPLEHIIPYEGVCRIATAKGYIVWRCGSGGTTELLHLYVNDRRKGVGTSLFLNMLDLIEKGSSIYGFTRQSSVDAQKFYLHLGFKLIALPNYYEDGGGCIFHQSLSVLKAKHDIPTN